MTLVLCRVDDRLIHGQVVIGWGIPLGVEHIVLVDETVAANDWEQDIYRMAVPASITVEFAGLTDAAARLRAWTSDPRRIFLLTGDISTMAAYREPDARTGFPDLPLATFAQDNAQPRAFASKRFKAHRSRFGAVTVF